MKFFAVHLEDMEQERFVSATACQVGTWLFLHALCSKQMNSGTIKNAADFAEQFWIRHGIDKRIIEAPCSLWSWEESDLVIRPYDIEGQELFARKVAGGKKGAATRWNRSPIKTTIESPSGSPNTHNPTQHNPRKRKSAAPSSLVAALWEIVPENGRVRSSKAQVQAALDKATPLPGEEILTSALRQWAASAEWTNDNGKYVQGLHLWIKHRRWESLPSLAQAAKPSGCLKAADLSL